MPEPIAVAFVEVRPDVSDFQSETEREVQGSLREQEVPLRANVAVSGLDDARRQLEALRGQLTTDVQLTGLDRALNEVARLRDTIEQPAVIPVESVGGEVRIEGIDQARRETDELVTSLQRVSQTDLGPAFAPLLTDARAAQQEVKELALAVERIPADIDLGSGLAASTVEAERLTTETRALGTELQSAEASAERLASTRIRLDGVESARDDVAALRSELERVSETNVAGTFTEAAEGVAATRAQVDQLAQSAREVPRALGTDITSELDAAGTSAQQLAANAADLATGLGDAGQAARALETIEVTGLADATSQAQALATALDQTATAKNIQISGLTEAATEVEELASALAAVEQIELGTTLAPVVTDAQRAQAAIQGLSSTVGAIPTAGGIDDLSSSLGDAATNADQAASGLLGFGDSTRDALSTVRYGTDVAKEFSRAERQAAAAAAEQAAAVASGAQTTQQAANTTVAAIERQVVAERELAAARRQGAVERIPSISASDAARVAENARRTTAARQEMIRARHEEGFGSKAALKAQVDLLLAQKGEIAALHQMNAERGRSTALAGEMAAAEATLTAQKLGGAAATKIEAIEEERQSRVRLRARRAAALGPFRLAGAGLLIGTGLFAATRALSDLSDALQVSGNEASTTAGKFRNFAAGAIQGDVVGAFKALFNNTYEYSVAQLKMINQTPELEKVLRSMGEGANFAASRLKALDTITQSAIQGQPDLTLRIAEAKFSGDAGAEIAAIQEADRRLVEASKGLDQVRTNQEEFARKLRELNAERSAALNEFAAAQADPTGDVPQHAGRLSLPSRVEEADQNVKDIEAEIAALKKENNVLRGPLRLAQAQLLDARREKRESIEALEREQAQERVSGITQKFGDRRLAAELAGASNRLAVILRQERAALQRIVDTEKQGTEAWRTAAERIKQINGELETIANQMAAEEQRHMQAMIDKRIFPSELAQARASALGDESALVAGLAAESAALQAAIDAKELRGQALIDAYNRIAANNAQIEGIAQANAAEAQRHKDEVNQAKQDEHQALLDSLNFREGKLQNALLKAQLTEGAANDIARTEALRDFYREQSRNQDLTKTERQAYLSKLLNTKSELARLRQAEREAREAEVQEEIDAREDLLQDKLSIAKTTDGKTSDDERALRQLIQFYRKQEKNDELSVAARRDYLVKRKQRQQELRQLLGEEKQQGKSFQTLIFEFLQAQQGFAAQLASNLLPEGFTFTPPSTTTTGPPPTPPVPGSKTTGGVQSPFGRPEGESGRAGAAAADIRDARGRPMTQGQGDEFIRLQRQTLSVLREIRTGRSHRESDYAAAKTRGQQDGME